MFFCASFELINGCGEEAESVFLRRGFGRDARTGTRDARATLEGKLLFELEFLLTKCGDAAGDADALVVLSEAAIVPFAVLFVVEDAQEGAEFGGFEVRRAGAVKGALHDGFNASVVVRNRVTIEKGEVVGHGEFVVQDIVELLFVKNTLIVAVEFVIGDVDVALLSELLDSFMVAEFFDPLVKAIAFVVREVVEFRDRFELGIHRLS